MVGPAIAHFGWTPTSYDELAGAVVAGHVLECGTQATGGNFSGFRELPRRATARSASRSPRSRADGSCVITKHAGTGGAVTVDTVTAQLVYEIQSTALPRPGRHDRASTPSQLDQDGPDRVAVSGVRGAGRRREQLKVCVNELGGFRNSMEFVLTGLDIEEKAAWVREQLEAARLTAELGHLDPHRDADPGRRHRGGRVLPAPVHGQGPGPEPVGKAFTGPAVELALASYPGFTLTAPPGPGDAVRRLPRRRTSTARS